MTSDAELDVRLEAARETARRMLIAARPAFSPEAGRATFQNEEAAALECSAFDPEGAAPAISRARSGDPDARAAVHRVIAGFLSLGETLPPPLLDYTMELLHSSQAGDGKRAHKFHARNDVIRTVVRAVMDYGFERTRSRGSRKQRGESACSIVAGTMAELHMHHMSEASIEDITDPLPSD